MSAWAKLRGKARRGSGAESTQQSAVTVDGAVGFEGPAGNFFSGGNFGEEKGSVENGSGEEIARVGSGDDVPRAFGRSPMGSGI